MIEHHEVVLVKGAGVAEKQRLAVHAPIEYHAAAAEGAIADEHRATIDDVVHQLMEVQELEG